MYPASVRVYRPSEVSEGIIKGTNNVPVGTFQTSDRYATDACGKKVRDDQNTRIDQHLMYNYFNEPLACEPSKMKGGMRIPEFVYEHPSLRATSIGVGVTDPCVVDTYSSLRNDPASSTRDRCKTQLVTRIFKNVPTVRPGGGWEDYNRLVPTEAVPQATVGNNSGGDCASNKVLMENEWGWKAPIVDSLRKELSDPGTRVEAFVRGGDTTRKIDSYTCNSSGLLNRRGNVAWASAGGSSHGRLV